MSVQETEIEPGIVVHVEPDLMIAFGHAETIALPGHETRDPHYFLVVDVDGETGTALCTPLLTDRNKTGNDWVSLDNQLKSGKPENWQATPSVFFKWQFWRVPLAAIAAASATDNSGGDRRFYAKGDENALGHLQSHLHRARNPWRSLP